MSVSNPERITTALWRTGVFVTLALLTPLVLILLNAAHPDVNKTAAEFISWTLGAGMVLMALSIGGSVLLVVWNRARGDPD